jgi:hypothetical protein
MKTFSKPLSLLSIFTLTISLFAATASADSSPSSTSVPNPTITGPIQSVTPGDPSHDYPFGATNMDLSKIGYVEEEFFVEGTASQYTLPSLETGTTIKDGDKAYKTRIIVRRPADQKNFNGTVLLEWYNVTAGLDIEFDWYLSRDYITRAGYAWVGVSAQPVGVNRLKLWSDRYKSLDVSDKGNLTNELSYDIYSQVAQALRNPEGTNPLGGLKLNKIIATGHSQSAGYLARYYNSIQPLHQVIDGFVIRGTSTPLRTDTNTKIFRTMAEGDVRQALSTATTTGSDEPDTENFRRWEVAGTSHVDWIQRQGYEPTLIRDLGGITPILSDRPPFSRIPFTNVQNAAYDYMVKWIDGRVVPPNAPRFTWEVDGVTKSRDSYGNALGGIRLPEHEVPTAVNTGDNSGPGFERLYGSHEPFDAATLRLLYPNHGSYVSKINHATNTILNQGFILKDDAALTRQAASKSSIGK